MTDEECKMRLKLKDIDLKCPKCQESREITYEQLWRECEINLCCNKCQITDSYMMDTQ